MKNNILNDFDNDFVKFISERNIYSYSDIEKVYVILNKSMDKTHSCLQGSCACNQNPVDMACNIISAINYKPKTTIWTRVKRIWTEIKAIFKTLFGV